MVPDGWSSLKLIVLPPPFRRTPWLGGHYGEGLTWRLLHIGIGYTLVCPTPSSTTGKDRLVPNSVESPSERVLGRQPFSNPSSENLVMPNLKTTDLTRRSFSAVAFALAASGILAGEAASSSKVTTSAKAARTNGKGLVADGRIDAGDLRVGYSDLGPGDGSPVLLFHGWPYDINAFAEVAPLLADDGYRVIVPHLRGYGSTKFLSADTMRNGQQSALAVDAVKLMDALKIERATVAGFDWGARTADIVAALWPERCRGLVSVSGYLIGNQAAGKAPLPPSAEVQWWYQFYFATERGRAGYEKYTNDFAKLIWQLASPHWKFDDATFERSAAAFSNPDHVAIVVHNYRWRLGLTDGEKRFDEFETKLASAPEINVPTITMEGDANGAPHPDPKAYSGKFKAKYEHRLISGGIGHNLPQEAPDAFAKAVRDVDSWA